MRLLLPILAVALLAEPLVAKPATTVPARAVKLGGDAEQDACGGVLKVIGLKARGDNFLSVRAAPSPLGREIDRLHMGKTVWACDSTQEGEWIGVVYKRRPNDPDCGVGTPITKLQPYAGPCVSGWVAGKFLELVAG